MSGSVWDLPSSFLVTGQLCRLGGQRYASDSQRGLDHALPPGLGKEEHMVRSADLPNPFSPRLWPEKDVQFVVDMIVTWQEAFPRFVEKCHQIFKSVLIAVQPLERWMEQHRSSTARLVASTKRPVTAALLVALLRWPDRDVALHLLVGFPIVGHLSSSGLFRPVTAAPTKSLQDWLGDDAVAAVDRLMASKPPQFAEEIVTLTRDEMKKGFCSDFLTRGQLDACYGRGQWRAIPRFLVQQPDGKLRAIDNGRKSQHNEVTVLDETITTVNVDFVAAIAKMLAMAFPSELPPWVHLRLGTDDLPDAYRGLAVQTDHMRYSNIAVYIPQEGWKFVKLYGLAFGLASAVISFNRIPALGIAAARRLLGGVAAAYFDDQLGIEVFRDRCFSRRAIQAIFRALGAPPHPDKSFAPAPNRHYLGTSVHVGDFQEEQVIRFQPKRATRLKVQTLLETVIRERTLSADQAGKLRGDLNWMYSNCSGQLGKLSGPLLTEKQAGTSPTLANDQLLTLELLLRLLQKAQPRDVDVSTKPSAPVRIYSDASFEDGVLRLGWILFDDLRTPTGGTCDVPDTVLHSWKARNQQIFPGETLCGLLIPWLHSHTMVSRPRLLVVHRQLRCSGFVDQM